MAAKTESSPKYSKSMTIKKKKKIPSGNSRAAKNKKIRHDALRDELKAREYLRQLSNIEQRLNPEHKQTYNQEDLPKIKERTGILFKLLDKCLPNLRPVDVPVKLNKMDSILNTGQEIVDSMMKGEISPQEASGLMQVISSQLKIVEIEDLTGRIERLEET